MIDGSYGIEGVVGFLGGPYLGKGQTLRVLKISSPIKTGTEAPVEMIILFSSYHCFNLRPYQPTVTIIKNIIMICAHSERVGIGSGDGVTLETAGPKGSVMSPEAGLVSPYWPSVSGSVTVLPETETRLVQSTQAPLMLLKYCVPAGKGCG